MKDLPKRCFVKNGAVYFVRAEGSKRKWVRLCAVRDGLPAVYKALADLTSAEVVDDRMPAVVEAWMAEVMVTHSTKTQANDAYQCRAIKHGLQQFRASEVTPSAAIKFLSQYRDKPRTHNAYRAMLRELMRFAETKDMRPPGSNPIDAIKTMPIRARTRYITDSELRRIKVAAVYYHDTKDGEERTRENRKRTRSGLMLCALIDMAYLTGQRIGDLIALQWPQVTAAGILFEPSKVADSTGARVMIEASAKLDAVVARLKGFKRRNLRWVFTTQTGQPYTYWGASTAWRRAVKRAGIKDCHFHDLRAKALTDVDARRGIVDAQRMGAHSTQTQTAGYVRNKTARRAQATR